MALAALLPHREPGNARDTRGDEERDDGEAERRDLRAADLERAARLDQPPLAALQDPEHGEAEPEGRQQHAYDVQLRPVGGRGGAWDTAVDEEDDHDDHVLGEKYVT